MSDPKAPDIARNWNSIDIFLFSNGQQYSPPRKYHLKSEELKCWDNTLNFLARSQFGSAQSNVELYTLDGKKIESPLNLTNNAAYVAVKPPDAFVQTGYEKYLLKATRSREKRQERLNSTETLYSGVANANLTVPNGITINNEKTLEEGNIQEAGMKYEGRNTFTKSQKDFENLQEAQTGSNTLKSEKSELSQKRKSGNFAKTTILKNKYAKTKNHDDGNDLNKPRNIYLKSLRKQSDSSKRTPAYSNNKKLAGQSVLKENPPTISTIDYIKVQQKTVQPKNLPQLKIMDIFDKKPTVSSNVDKNTASDIQSAFLDTNEKTVILNNDQIRESRVLNEAEEYERIPKNTFKSHKETFKHNPIEIHTKDNILNHPSTINLNLNIDINGCRFLNIPNKRSEGNCKSYIGLITSENASQMNVNVNLSSNTLNFAEGVLLQDQCAECNLAKTCGESIPDHFKKVITIRCRCNVLNSDSNKLSTRNYEESNNYISLIQSQKCDKCMQSSDLEIGRTSEKEMQESYVLVPTMINSELASNKNFAKPKGSMSQEAPPEINFHNLRFKSLGEDQTILTNHYKTPNKIDTFAQTDWCNLLIQAKYHEDGHYSFHLPPLQLLTHYNLL